MAKLNAKLASSLTGQRAGFQSTRGNVLEESTTRGLKLSAVQNLPLANLKENTQNAIFDQYKTDQYFKLLEEDIAKDGIINPLIIDKTGLIIEGHSRFKIAKKLNLETVPTLMILSGSQEEIDRRLILGNLNRFEIPYEAKVLLYAQIYPHYFDTHKNDVRLDKTISAKEIAETIGISDRQLRNQKKEYQLAKKLALEAGKALTPSHLKQAKQALKIQANVKDRSFTINETATTLELFDADNELALAISKKYVTDPNQLKKFIKLL